MNGFNSILQKKKVLFQKNTLKNTKLIKNTLVKVLDPPPPEIQIFLLQNALNNFFDLYYDYWNLITKF